MRDEPVGAPFFPSLVQELRRLLSRPDLFDLVTCCFRLDGDRLWNEIMDFGTGLYGMFLAFICDDTKMGDQGSLTQRIARGEGGRPGEVTP